MNLQIIEILGQAGVLIAQVAFDLFLLAFYVTVVLGLNFYLEGNIVTDTAIFHCSQGHQVRVVHFWAA